MTSANDGQRRRRDETPLQRERRLARQQVYNNRRQKEGSETTAEREHRLARQREYNRRRRASAQVRGSETVSESERRLAQQREYNHRQRGDESAEQREQRLSHQREYSRRRKAEETAQQREQRLARQREYNRRRRMNVQHQQSATNEADHLVAAPDSFQETSEQRRERLAHQRKASHARREHERLSYGSTDHGDVCTTSLTPGLVAPAPHSTHEQAHILSSSNTTTRDYPEIHVGQPESDGASLSPVSDQQRRAIEEKLHFALGGGLDEGVCAVCDRLVLRKLIRLVELNHTALLESMRRVLKCAGHNLPDALMSQYACDDLHPELKGLLLSRKGILESSRGQVLCICDECDSSLQKCHDRPPKFSIANGFFIGYLPDELFQATWIEKVMTQLVTVVAQTRIMRGGRHRAIRSHCMVFDATPGPPATLLPRRIDRDGSYRVVLAGPVTSEQGDRIRKLHLARGHMVQGLLRFFKANNVLYDDVEVDNAATDRLDADTNLFDRIIIQEGDPETASAVDEEQTSVARESGDIINAEGEDEGTVIERNSMLLSSEVAANATYAQRVVDLNPRETTSTPRLRVHHSSDFASAADIEAKMYPHLFPFGRGHPSESRSVPVSRRDCIRYYAMLSSRRFAQDPTFLLTSFARLALENMYTLTSVKCRRYRSIFEGYEALSREDVAAALLDNERRQRGGSRQAPVNPDAARFLKSVELGSVSVWGSNAERRQCRRDAFGYQTRFGQPSLFVTLTPNTDNSYAMAHYTGILSVHTLFDALEARIPTMTEMRKAAMVDDCASARLFMRVVDAFLTDVLGVDPKTSKTSGEGGLFGKTKAYFGMVETQGRGTLHIHFLIWLSGAPVNSVDFDRNIAALGDTYIRSLEEYVDSVVTTQLPVSIDQAPCTRCQARESLKPLPIPTTARRDVSKKRQDREDEPLLVWCDSCGLQSSSRYVLRQALLQARPPHWPPPLAQLSPDEIAKRTEQEAVSRLSVAEAAARLANREMFLASLSRDANDTNGDWLLEVGDEPQQGRIRNEEEPFKCDTMNRLIEMLPPTVDADRMDPNHFAYMVSSLVLNLNMHAWTHTNSCFKMSRTTKNSSICRYGFPRARCNKSSIVGPTISIRRDLAHEYINGYNPTIMAAFKCNHDIQVLFGGKEAINRIYYCCKYVTKSQRPIDSSTAVALASFDRRQSKEVRDARSEEPPSVHDLRRRRVTGLVHTNTNKQEIAGPLAALYVLRGSCCYSMFKCVKLPFTDVLRQLEHRGDYACTLVEAEITTDTIFTSASHLDDYIYRPRATDGMSLFEFAMKCYRRRATPSVSSALRFSALHPLSSSHCIAIRRVEAVPVIAGPRLPRWKEEMSPDEQVQYARLALVMFKPFRSVSDLIGTEEVQDHVWLSVYQEWERSRTPFTRMIMNNMNDYHMAQAAEDDAEVVATAEQEHESAEADSDCSSSDDGYYSDDFSGEAMEADEALFGLLDEDMQEDNDDGDGVQVFPSPPDFPTRHQRVIDQFERYQLVEGLSQEVVSLRDTMSDFQSTMSASELKMWVENEQTDSHDGRGGDVEDPVALDTGFRATSVEEIIDASLLPEEMVWERRQPAPLPQNLPSFSGIADISRSFTLNELQHGAFAIVATHLLRRWKPGTQPAATSDEELDRQQLRMFLGGEGGTGKSRVIQAIQGLCQSWQRPDAVVVSALTGKAASLIGGRTLASFEMTLKRSSAHISVQDLDCLIIDEVSMMTKRQLASLDVLLRAAKRINNVAFGGIHVILVGDFLQLPPVRADPLFVETVLTANVQAIAESTDKTKAKARAKAKADIRDHEGFKLWKLFDKVVVLRESVRFKDDPEWGRGCSKARHGEWTPEFVDLINSRAIENLHGAPENLPRGTVFVTPDNSTRTVINCHFTAHTAREVLTEELPIRVVANFKGALNKLSVADISHVMSLPDTRFGRMAPYLDLIPGMPIQITQNVRTRKGVANGTMGTLHSVHFPPDTTFRKALDRRTATIVLLPDKRPTYALVALDRGRNCIPLADGVDPQLFPLFPDAEPFSKADIDLTPSQSGDQRRLSIKIQQFPFVCAVGATVYKVQGESLSSMVVVDWKAGQGANQPQQVYLVVSRVVTRHALLSLKRLTPDILAWAKPSPHALAEDSRLGEESVRTLSEFYESARCER